MTADNVAALKDLDLLDLIDVKDFEIWKERTGKHSLEEWALDSEIYGIERFRALAHYFCGDYYNIKYGDKPRKTYTNLLGYNEEVVGSGICTVGNALIFPYANTNTEINLPISLICPLREKAIKKALIDRENVKDELYYVEEENVCVYAFEKEDAYYFVFVNFSDDDYDSLHFYSSQFIKDMKIFTPDNANVRSVSYTNENGKCEIKHKLKAQESYVIVCNNTID